MNNNDINKLKADRARDVRIMKDKTASTIARMSLPAIVLMVGVMIWSSRELPPEAIAVVASLVTAITTALIQVLHKMTGSDREDPMVQIAKELIDHLTEDNSKEIIMDDKSIRIVGKHSKVVQGKDLVWGDDAGKKK